MRRGHRIAWTVHRMMALGVAGLVLAGAARAEDFYAEVRSLQRVQDQMAQGDPAAQSTRLSLVRAIAKTHANGLGIDHLSGRDRTALLLYILGGGDPQVGMILSEVGALGDDEARILAGGRAWGAGDKITTLARLRDVRPELLAPALGGQVALVRASVRPADDSGGMMHDLILAETLAPGTLVEEAALRRRASLAVKARDFNALMRVARRYYRIFPRSLYASHFLASLMESMAEFDYEEDHNRLEEIGKFMSRQPEAMRGPLCVALARAGLDHGSQQLTRYAADQALALASVQGSLRARATLYAASMAILGDPPVRLQALATLKALDSSLFDAQDRAVRRDALALGMALNHTAEPPAGPAEPASTPIAPQPDASASAPPPASTPVSVADTVKQAQAVQSAMIEALKESTP